MFLKLSNRHEWLLAIRDDYCGELTWKIKYSFPLFWKWHWAGRDCCKTSRLCLYLCPLPQLLMGSWSETQTAWVCSWGYSMSLQLKNVLSSCVVKMRIYHSRFPFWPTYYKTVYSDLQTLFSFRKAPWAAHLLGSTGWVGGRSGTGVESWPQSWAGRWCHPARTIPRGGPGTLETVLEVRTSFVLGKIDPSLRTWDFSSLPPTHQTINLEESF